MRKIIFSLLDPVLLALDVPVELNGAGALTEDTLPLGPFAVMNFSKTPGMGKVNVFNFQIRVHDRGGDYTNIDDALAAIYGTLDSVQHVSEPDGGSAELIRAEWQFDSDDLSDPGFRTITKNSNYRLIGTGA